MPPFTQHLHHDVTHWPVTGSNGYGGFTFDTGVEIKGRWEEKAELFRDNNNEEQVSHAIVYLNTDVDVGDYLAQGKHKAIADPTTLTDADRAYRALQRHKTTDLRSVTCLRKVFL